MSLGGSLFEGNSKLFDLPLGVVKAGFDGYDLGKTTADAEFTPDQDIKDIIFQQDGTKASDHVRTGIDYMLALTFGEINTGLLKKMMAGITSENEDTGSDSGTINRNIYQSMRDNEAGVLKIAAVDENGVPSEEPEDIIFCYEAIPIVDGALVNWGADTQRGLTINFRIKWHLFSAGESTTKSGAFGYWGDPTTEDLPVATWPDVEAPILLTGIAVLATSLELTFNEDIAFQTAWDAEHYQAKVEGAYAPSTAGTITAKVLTLTFGAATFASGNDIEINISELALEDTEVSANVYAGIDAFVCTDTI